MTIVVFIITNVVVLKTSFQNCLLCINENIDCFKTITIDSRLYITKVWLAYVSESRNLPYKAIIRDHSLQGFIMSLVATNGFHSIIFHQVLSIGDWLCRLGKIKCELK